VDEYLADHNQVELGVRRRGGKLEVKGLVTATFGNLASSPFVGPIELWTKWTSEVLELGSALTVSIEKTRWLRKFDTATPSPEEIPLDSKENPLRARPLPALGCNVELTRIMLRDKSIWWTLGFESFGTIQTVGRDLTAVALTLAARRPPEVATGLLASYPVWLKEQVVTTKAM
jgi:hypothetical protein